MTVNSLEKAIFKSCGFQEVDPRLTEDLDKIINWREKIQLINVDNVKPMYSTIDDDSMYISNEDVNIQSNDNVLSNSPKQYDNFFLVPKIIKN